MHRIPLGWQEATGKSRAAENIAECQGGPHHSLFPQTLPAWPELPVGAVVPAERRVLGRPRGAARGDSCTSVGSQYQSRRAPLPSGPQLVPLCPGAGAPPSYSAGPQNLGPILNASPLGRLWSVLYPGPEVCLLTSYNTGSIDRNPDKVSQTVVIPQENRRSPFFFLPHPNSSWL